MIRECLDHNPPRELDLTTVDAVIAKDTEHTRPDSFFFVGKYLDLTGHSEQAKTYLLKCVKDSDWDHGNSSRHLAWTMLRQKGVPVKELNDAP
jgi:hypothetical protein